MCAVSVPLAALLDAGWAVAAGLGRTLFLKPQHNGCSAAFPAWR